MIDPTVSLAFSIYSNKGAYALLLGSGTSRSAEIMTGWEITLDLIRRIAVLEKASNECEPDPEEWYAKRFGTPPDYSDLLDQLSTTPADRRQILRGYFEPSDEDREQGRKQPSATHTAIARLVKAGYIRVLVTTNFDRLIEEALRSEGIEPQIVTTPDGAEGAVPLAHERCTLLKVNGDYLDTRIKNTVKELESYDLRTDALLDKIFDEYGLIVCGWSAIWDTALRSALERCKSHRFSSYWAIRGEPAEEASKLIATRRAVKIKISDADSFFTDLTEKVFALESVGARHPLTSRIAVSRLKSYIENNKLVSLSDLVEDETEQVATYMNNMDESAIQAAAKSSDAFQEFLTSCESKTEVLQILMGTGCYWGEERHEKIWVNCLQRVINVVEHLREINEEDAPALYPPLLLLYSGGIAAVAAERYRNLEALLHRPQLYRWEYSTRATVLLNTCFVFGLRFRKILNDHRWFIFSDRLRNNLRTSLRELLPDERRFDKSFERFEYLQSLDFIDLKENSKDKDLFGEEPLGQFVINYHKSKDQYPERAVDLWNVVEEVGTEASRTRQNWLPLKAGFFGGSFERFEKSRQILDGIIANFFHSGTRMDRRCK